MSAVYAITSHLLRRQLWNEFNTIQSNYPDVWSLIGDFNSVLVSREVKGSHSPLKVAYDEFKQFSDLGSWTHILTRGSDLTWSNGRKGIALTEKRLDRSMCNDA